MAAFVILDLSIHDPKEIAEYQKLAPAAIAAYNGKFVVRGGQLSTLEGEWSPERFVIIEFETVEKAKEWYHSEAYQKASIHRKNAADSKIIIVEGV